MALGHLFDVVLNRLEEKPSRISRIKPSIVSLIVQIGNQTMSRNFCKENYCISCLFVEASD